MMITHEALLEALHYDPRMGVFTWRARRRPGIGPGKVAGCISDKGYRCIEVCGKAYKAHRLAWFYVTGAWPSQQIDHRNGIRDDNRFDNLREATNSQNMMNVRPTGKLGLKGVQKNCRRYVAIITVDKRQIRLGSFSTPEEAAAAYSAAALRYFGEFARVA